MYVCICICVGMHIYVCLKETKFCFRIENFYQFFVYLNILNIFLSIKIHTLKNSVNDFLKGICFIIFMLRNSSHLPKVWYIYIYIYIFFFLSPFPTLAMSCLLHSFKIPTEIHFNILNKLRINLYLFKLLNSSINIVY